MQTFVVGGWVRDQLLRARGSLVPAPGDRDWVVVGAEPNKMLELGFQQVGRDFPVFLHPHTHEEYALARTERKTAPGYRGFVVHAAPDVTLSEDLHRRDLTINAMAVPAKPEAPPTQVDLAQLTDPYGGLADLEAGVLRHVGPAFVEDPVRILRLARFAARFSHFTVAPETKQLCADMVKTGETDSLIPERVWQEWSRGLMENHPELMLDFLNEVGLLSHLAPGLNWGASVRAALQRAAQSQAQLSVRFAVLTSSAQTPEPLSVWMAHWRCDAESAQMAKLVLELQRELLAANEAEAMCVVLSKADAWRRPARFETLLEAIRCVCPDFTSARWQAALQAGLAVPSGEIARSLTTTPQRIPDAIAHARLELIRARLQAG